MSRLARVGAALVLVLSLGAGADAATPPTESAVPAAHCGPGSRPETGLQGQVPLRDRTSGRSTQGYSCNLVQLGRYQGQGTSYVSASYGHCAYLPQSFPTSLSGEHPGVTVVDVRDPRRPTYAGSLTSPAFLSNTWESLKVNPARGLLAGVSAGPGEGVAFFDVYDIRTDCLHPRLLNSVSSTELSLPANAIGHEGQFAPDGLTYWTTSLGGGLLVAIDIRDTASPKVAYFGGAGVINHGFELSADGNRLYLANVNPEGLEVLDVSAVQRRDPVPSVRSVGSLTWTDGATGQHTIPVTWKGRKHLVFVDEGGNGAARIIDISDETRPRIVSRLKLEIHLPQHADARAEDLANTGAFGYEGHYCSVDSHVDPTALACGYFQSGVRVFDVRDPLAPKEIAYFNPPAQLGRNAELPGSEHASGLAATKADDLGNDLTTDWCTSPPRFVSRDQLWVTCQDNGFLTLRFTNGAYPLRRAT